MPIPGFGPDGNLPPGIHWATWDEFEQRFGTTPHRKRLIAGLRAALESLRVAGCGTAYIDGSFVTIKEVPSDFDGCWEIMGVDPTLLDRALLTFDRGRLVQKATFGGELFPANAKDQLSGVTFLQFFQSDKATGSPKGIIA